MCRLPSLGADEQVGGSNVKIVGPWLVSVVPMIYNDRVVLTHLCQYPMGLSVGGWCYDKGIAAPIAAGLWDPTKDPRPEGYKKEAFFDEQTWKEQYGEHDA